MSQDGIEEGNCMLQIMQDLRVNWRDVCFHWKLWSGGWCNINVSDVDPDSVR